jgi:hypothetical protein
MPRLWRDYEGACLNMKCDAQICDDTRDYIIAHPFGGEVHLCRTHYNKVLEAQDAVILQLLRTVGV